MYSQLTRDNLVPARWLHQRQSRMPKGVRGRSISVGRRDSLTPHPPNVETSTPPNGEKGYASTTLTKNHSLMQCLSVCVRVCQEHRKEGRKFPIPEKGTLSRPAKGRVNRSNRGVSNPRGGIDYAIGQSDGQGTHTRSHDTHGRASPGECYDAGQTKRAGSALFIRIVYEHAKRGVERSAIQKSLCEF